VRQDLQGAGRTANRVDPVRLDADEMREGGSCLHAGSCEPPPARADHPIRCVDGEALVLHAGDRVLGNREESRHNPVAWLGSLVRARSSVASVRYPTRVRGPREVSPARQICQYMVFAPRKGPFKRAALPFRR